MDHLCYLYLVFVMVLRLFIPALWSQSVEGLTSWLSFVMLYCVLSLSHVVSLVPVWYLIVLIPDLCQLSYFNLLVYNVMNKIILSIVLISSLKCLIQQGFV